MKFRVGSKIQWKWLGRAVDGVVKEVHTKSITKTIKGKQIKRNGSEEIPAYLVESESGNLALKLESELHAKKSASAANKTSKPKMFS